MAAAYEALASLMNTIEQIKNHPLISTFFFKEQLESVGQEVVFLLNFIEKYSSHGGNDGLEKRIASAAKKVEGVMESHIADQIRPKKRSKRRRRRSIFLVDLHKIIEEMDCIKEETIKVKEETRSKEQRPACSISAATTSRKPHQTRMVGFDDVSSQLMDVLTREESSRQIISVVGMGGIDIERERRIMLSDDSTETTVLTKLLRSILREELFRQFKLYKRALYRGLHLQALLELLRVNNMADDSLKAIFKYRNLRFLFYQPQPLHTCKPVVVIPPSVSLIWNLQTLAINVHHVVAPLEIWNLQQLRHVECYEIYIPDPPQNVQPVVLENLQTLIRVVNLRLSEEVCKRIPNVSKLYVEYNHTMPGSDRRWCDHLHNLGTLHKLRSLKLVSSLSIRFVNRSSFGAGWRKCTFPTSLKKLKLINCHIHWNDLRRISSLPHLEVLKLDRIYPMKGQKWSPADGEFPALKVLSIANCDLRCWNADSSHFPVLQRLVLDNLSRLKEIPLDIGEIPTLELIHVGGCSKSAQISAEKIKEEQQNQGNDCLQIQIQTCSLVLRAALTIKYISE
ncbi:hypothetical protein C2S51_024031 [Perilla frutescens var. frutescens]|nr:hypothetical protein C2S51_024031 [Perilla frutescens var. frutescens]